MNKPSYDLLTNLRTGQGQTLLFGKVMVALLMCTLAISVVHIGERFTPGWGGAYLIFSCLIIAVEAMVIRKRAKELEGQERVIFHVSEWIAILIALKILIYLIRGPAQLLVDLPRWQENFIENFFSGEYIVAIVLAAIVWFNSYRFAGDLEDLYDEDIDTGWDELGKLQNALHTLHSRISTRIFIMGSVVVLLTALSRVDATAVFRSLGKPPAGYYAPVVNVLAFFIIALVLLSQTQFAMLRSRWLWQQIPVNPGIAKNWVKYGLLFFIVMAIIVFFLPTEYTVGLIDVLRYILGLIFQLLALLLTILTIPFTFCLSLFRISSENPEPTTPAQPAAPPMIFDSPAQQPIGWLEILRSLLFWLIFLAVIFFAFRFYFAQNAALWKVISSFPLFRWVRTIWNGLWKWVRGANRQIRGMVKAGIARLRAQRTASPVETIRRMFNFGRLNPREKIIYFYVHLVAAAGEQGLERKPSQTPYQYETRLREAIPEVDQELHNLTDTFLEARYSQHPIEQPNAEQANSLWERIKAALREWKREK